MNYKKMWRLERWLGIPLCFALTIHRRIYDRLFLRSSGVPKRILFIKLIEQGSTILAFDALKTAVDRVGPNQVFFLVFKENRQAIEILEIIPRDNIFVISTDSVFQFLRSTLSCLLQIRKREVDTVIDLELFTRAPALLSYLCGAKLRVGLHRFNSEAPYRGDLFTHRVQYQPYLHISVYFRLLVDVAFKAGDEFPSSKIEAIKHPMVPQFEPSESEREALRKKLSQMSPEWERSQIIIVNPNASDLIALRRWPIVHYQELIQKVLVEWPAATVILTGGPNETQAATDLMNTLRSDRVISLAGQTSLRELLTLYSLADILVTNESGPGVFSSMTSISTVVLFGPDTPVLYGSLGGGRYHLRAGLACSPCVNALNHRMSPCNNNLCMQLILPNQVFEAMQLALRDRS